MSITPSSARNRRRRDSTAMPMPNPIGLPASARGAGLSSARGNASSTALADASSPGASATTPTAAAAETPSASARRQRRNTVMDVNSALQTTANSMKVYIRVRPFSERELEKKMSTHSTVRIDAQKPEHITLLDPNKDFKITETYSFTRCFWSVLDKEGGSASANIQQTVDTFLNGGMNSARRRSRAASVMGGLPMSSARNRAMSMQVDPSAAAGLPLAPQSVGSAAAVADGAGVTHPPYAGQDEVYRHVGHPILENTLEGYNGCVFAYGQTGSGKTFTMLGYAPDKSDIKVQRKRRESMANMNGGGCGGPFASGGGPGGPANGVFNATGFCDPNDDSTDDFERQASPQVIPPAGAGDDDELIDEVVDFSSLDPNNLQGIIPRITTELFIGLRRKCEIDPSRAYRVEVSYYEIYNEKVYDLLRPNKNVDLKIRNSPTTGPFIEDLTKKVAVKEEEVAKLIRKGSQERHTAATKFNDRSSRSHAILTYSIVQTYMNDDDTLCTMQSKLNLVDLAGSERTGAAGAEGNELKEGNKINQSLMVLGRVIDCLADLSHNKSLAVPVPYRHSNLTWLLSDSLGGNSQTSMIATISPHALNYDEMRQTIRYASRAKQIVQRAVVNEDPHAALTKRLKGEIARLEAIIQDSGGAEYTKEYVKGLEKKVRQLEKKVAEQERVIVGLRIELERAGISDPTMEEGYDAEGGSPSPKQRAAAAQAVADAAALEKAKEEAEELRKELAERAAVSTEELAGLQQQLSETTELVANLRGEIRRRDNAFQATGEWDLQCVMPLVQAKEDAFIAELLRMRASTDSEKAALIAKLQKDHDAAVAELKRNHAEEMAVQNKQHESATRDLVAEHSRAQQQMADRHRDALASLEQGLRHNKEAYDQREARLREELEATKAAAEAQAQRLREQYQQDLANLRERLESGIDSRQKTADALADAQAAHAREMQKLQDDLDRARRARDADVQRLKNELENEALKARADLMERDRVKRQQDAEIVDLRRQLLQSQQERGRAEREMQDQIKDLMEQQEQLITVSNAVLADWEGKSSTMEADMCALRALVYDQDYMNARQKMREFAFRERRDYTKDFESLNQKEKQQSEAMRVLAERLRKAKASQESTLSKYAQEVKSRSPRPNANISKPSTTDTSFTNEPSNLDINE